MLYSLTIKNIALIDSVSLQFTDGFNAITGETGAGKSILVDSINLLLGERADRELVRRGTDCARVEGVFNLTQPNIDHAAALDMDISDGMLIIERTVNNDGRGLIKANGRAITLAALRSLMAPIADIYGQHEQQNLLKKERHIQYIDAYCHDTIFPLIQKTTEAYKAYSDVLLRLNEDWGTEEERLRRTDILLFQTNEIENAALEDGEEEKLLKQRQRLRNAERIAEDTVTAHEALAGDEGAVTGLSVALKALEGLSRYGDEYGELAERLRSAYIEADDIAGTLSNILDDAENYTQTLESVENRLQLIHEITRKYGGTVAAALAFKDNAQKELDRLENAAQLIKELEKQKQITRKALTQACTELTAARTEAAEKLRVGLLAELAGLGMPNADFKVEITSSDEAASSNGWDTLEFMFTANLGEPLKPLVKVISGGEMSRFMLALKNIMADNDLTETMIFDEVDSGISGKTATITAEKIKKIAQKHQVLCVTHLPQIAALADTHFYISKSEQDGRTSTDVALLNYSDRVGEVARLAGGDGEEARRHAAVMIEKGRQKNYD